MTDIAVSITPTTSPFDTIRQVREDGTEYWSARDLMPLLGYNKWQAFDAAIERAITSAKAQNASVEGNFTGAGKVSGERGPAQKDYHLSRFVSYLVATNGDPRKEEVAAAQAYFAVRTREAETKPSKQLTGPELMAYALLEAQKTIEAATARAEAAEAQIEADKPHTDLGKAITGGDGDLLVQDVARLLAAHGINIGRNRLYEWMRENHWGTKGAGRNGNQPTQRRIEQGLVRPRVQAIRTPAGHTIEAVTTLITGKGQEDLINGFLNGSYTI